MSTTILSGLIIRFPSLSPSLLPSASLAWPGLVAGDAISATGPFSAMGHSRQAVQPQISLSHNSFPSLWLSLFITTRYGKVSCHVIEMQGNSFSRASETLFGPLGKSCCTRLRCVIVQILLVPFLPFSSSSADDDGTVCWLAIIWKIEQVGCNGTS